MFGKNPVRKQELLESGELWVQEVFPTLQGEGPNAGCPAVFVRLAGCNLRCWFCDTDFESSDLRLTPEALSAQVQHEGRTGKMIDLCVLTGGEPLRQNILPFISLMVHADWIVQIETAGTLWVDGLEAYCRDRSVEIVCSPKTPKVHPMIEEHCWDYKYIVQASEPLGEDGLPFAVSQGNGKHATIALRAALYRPHVLAQIWVQPCDEYDYHLNRANADKCTELALRHGYRVSLQTHKILRLK